MKYYILQKNSKKKVPGKTNRLLSLIRHEPHRKRRGQHYSTAACVFVAAVTFLPSHCLTTRWISTEPLPSNDKGIHIQTTGFVKYAAEMDSGAMIYIPSYIKFDSAIRKSIGGIHSHTNSMKIT
jgi:hypothetical protein